MWGAQRLVFAVPLPRRDPVFMSMGVSECEKKRYGIVIVDSEKFLQLWRSDPRPARNYEADGSPETWPNDHKYKDADARFYDGPKNPVPLAYVTCGTARQVKYATFTDGITRTIWLLTQGCAAFPVKCDLASAKDLFLLAGVEGGGFYTVRDLAESL